MKRQTMFATWLRIQLILVIVACLTFSARAQTTASAPGQPQAAAPETFEHGGYVVHQSVEIGHRVSDVAGSELMDNPLRDLRTGPRSQEQSLSMQSQNHDSLLF